MADVKLNTLPQSTSPTSTQDLLLFDESTNAGQRINYNTLADVILAKLTSKTYTVGGGTQTLISAIDALNSKFLEKRLLDNGGIKQIVFDTYSTGALIFGTPSNSNPFVYVYSNGYLAPVVTNNNINVALSSDYKTVTITNNSSASPCYLDVISMSGNADIIDT